MVVDRVHPVPQPRSFLTQLKHKGCWRLWVADCPAPEDTRARVVASCPMIMSCLCPELLCSKTPYAQPCLYMYIASGSLHPCLTICMYNLVLLLHIPLYFPRTPLDILRFFQAEQDYSGRCRSKSSHNEAEVLVVPFSQYCASRLWSARGRPRAYTSEASILYSE